MKFVAITFDDGRADNYTTAFHIMKKYQIKGTLFVTTGFVDGTWQKNITWRSAGEAITIQQLKELYRAGWEIGLHGDRHITDRDDAKISRNKMNIWLEQQKEYGFSIPNSDAEPTELEAVKQLCYENEILKYIRTGRGRNTQNLTAKVLYGLYSVFGSQHAYNRFNAPSINDLSRIDRTNIKSVVVRCGDNPKMISRFIRQAPDNSLVVLMLYSILDKTDALYGADPWCWDKESFERLCADISDMERKNITKTMTLEGALISELD